MAIEKLFAIPLRNCFSKKKNLYIYNLGLKNNYCYIGDYLISCNFMRNLFSKKTII